MTGAILHQPVLLKESIDLLNIRPNQAYLDCTLGSGGHAEKILKKGGKLYGLDVDPQALKRTKKHLIQACPDAFFHLKKANFTRLNQVAQSFGLTKIAGILFDLGLSSEQLADIDRGFSFKHDVFLDMRADPSLQVTAADLLNGLSKKELNELFKKLGQEQYSLAIANAVVLARRKERFNTTGQLADLIKKVKRGKSKIHPATKVFQALRIAVNDELNNLKAALPQAVDLLEPNGRLVVISFHSLEDKIVKNFIKNNPQLKNLTKKPIIADSHEISINPKASSAKLRAAQKI